MGNFFSCQISCDAIFSRFLDFCFGKAAYIHDLQKNLGDLQTEYQKLVEAGNDVMRRVTIAEENPAMKRLDQVQGWLSRVETMGPEVDELREGSSREIEKLCLGGYCSRNCKSSYKFGKKVAEKLKAVKDLKSEGDFNDVAEMVVRNSVDEMPIDPTIIGLQSTFDKVWRCLRENQVGIVGLYGPGGVGKTTLLTQINNKLHDEKHDFDIVIWVVVSRDHQLEKIQEAIGKKIGLSSDLWKNQSLMAKATDIFKILKKKKFVLLLDDIWKRVDLTKVGVPQSQPASKIVFTTRFSHFCGEMEAGKHFRVEFLGDEEAWELFQTKVGDDTLHCHPEIPELAKIVAKECRGLPLALITIGRAMAWKKSPEEWNYAIQVLRKSASQFPGMDEVYPRLKFSYDNLPNDTIRSCFLYCCLFPEDFEILKTELIDFWLSEGFLDEYDGSEARYKGYDIIGILLNACLLEATEDDDDVKMHDVIRDMALWIAREVEKENGNFLVHAGAGLKKLPDFDKWKGVQRLSLMKNQIEKLSETPTCPRLLTLFLRSNKLNQISNDFFQLMSLLRVLDLSWNRSITELPLGISKLVSLQHLDLSGTDIQELPNELKALTNLRCLALNCTFCLHTIPQKLISSFSKLNVLRMFLAGSRSDQIPEDSVLFGGKEFLVEEVLHLENLNALDIDLGSTHALQSLLSSDKLSKCVNSVRLHNLDSSKCLSASSFANMKNLRVLDIDDCEELEEVKIGEILKMRESHCFQSLQYVRIGHCSQLRDLTWLVLFPKLKYVVVDDCARMEEIISVGRFGEIEGMIENLNPFAKLRRLVLDNLPELKSIARIALPFPDLNGMLVVRCPKLKKLPLDSNGAAGRRKIQIEAEEDWWKELEWEDEATQNVFVPLFEDEELEEVKQSSDCVT